MGSVRACVDYLNIYGWKSSIIARDADGSDTTVDEKSDGRWLPKEKHLRRRGVVLGEVCFDESKKMSFPGKNAGKQSKRVKKQSKIIKKQSKKVREVGRNAGFVGRKVKEMGKILEKYGLKY